jgi:hypothetical protein
MKSWITNLKSMWTTLQNAVKIQQQTEHNQMIAKKVQQRQEDMTTNQKRMINSILDRFPSRIVMNKLYPHRPDEEAVTDPDTIKNMAREHFEHALIPNAADKAPFQTNWVQQYHPKKHVNADWYKETLRDFEPQEVTDIIKHMKATSAPGCSQLSYPVLKHIGTKAI